MSAETSAILPRSLLKDPELTSDRILELLELARQLKTSKRSGTEQPQLGGKNIAILFEKPSTRTRAAFEVATFDQGGRCTYLDGSSSHMGTSESVEDTARVLGRFYDGIAFRGFEQESVETLARYAGVPVWNGLTRQWHPTQALADLLTMHESIGAPLTGVSVCFLGDGENNVARSLMVSGATLGMDVRIAAPTTMQPDPETVDIARHIGKGSSARILVTDDIDEAVSGADFLYTDVWVSMGESAERWQDRVPKLTPYRVDRRMMERTHNPRTRFLHCLPSIHNDSTELGKALYEKFGLDGAEVSDDVFSSAQSLVFDQAENRLHTIKALMVSSLGHQWPTER
jgi:ornithine carbamoyltransferase